jgi:hypothetical protein
MTSHFIITSAIYTSYGKCSTEERIEQTRETLKSIETYDKMKKDIIYASTTKKQADIEHLLYQHLNKKLVQNIHRMGIEGYWAPLRRWIEE